VPIRASLDADRLGAMTLLDLFVPHGRRFADMTVGVDHAVCHLVSSGFLARLGG
jgi:hypothetical protein